MINKEIADIFDSFADIYEILGDELGENDKQLKYKIRAYRQGSQTVQNLSQDLKEVVEDPEKNLEALPGIGSAMANKIREYVTTGKIREYEDLRKMVPPGLLEMLELDTVGPKKVKLFYTELETTTLKQLQKAILDGKVATLPRMGEKSAQKILDAIERYQNQPKRFLLGSALKEINSAKEFLLQCPEIDRIDHAGSARRQKETVGDIDIICSSKKPEKVCEHFKKYAEIAEIIADGDTKISVYLKSGLQLDLRVVHPDEFGAALQYFTGSKAHNVKLRTIAKKLGFKINEYGIFANDTGEKVGGKEEADIYITLSMQTPPAETRENSGEIELAQQKQIPQLIELSDIKGDLHVHSTYSDGKRSIKEMAAAAAKLGYEYLAITDHSPSLGVANGLNQKRLSQKQKEINQLNKNSGIRILYGTEVDILADSTLDYNDQTLSEFDIVIASVHNGLNKNNTDRIIAAIENPHVHIIGHPTTRLLNKRDPSPNDWPRIYKAAAANGTILEINANPLRLDLEGRMIQEAAKYGCMFTINTDAHNEDNLLFMPLGIGQARRGMLTADQVINTFPLSKLLKTIKQT